MAINITSIFLCMRRNRNVQFNKIRLDNAIHFLIIKITLFVTVKCGINQFVDFLYNVDEV